MGNSKVSDYGDSTLGDEVDFDELSEDFLDELFEGLPANKVLSVNTKDGEVVITPDDLDDSTTNNKFVDSGLINKLNNVEEYANVTDYDNVEAAGAVMEGDYGEHTILKADDAGFPYAMALPPSTLLGRASIGDITPLTPFDVRSLLSLVPGVNVQDFSALLSLFAGLSAGANKLPYFTSSSSMGLLDVVDPTTFTPGFTAIANVASFGTQSSGFYFRLNDFVVFFGRFSLDPTVGNTNTEFTMNPPVASNFSLFTDAGGTFACLDSPSISGGIRAETTLDKITFKYMGTAEAANKEFSYLGGYRII